MTITRKLIENEMMTRPEMKSRTGFKTRTGTKMRTRTVRLTRRKIYSVDSEDENFGEDGDQDRDWNKMRTRLVRKRTLGMYGNKSKTKIIRGFDEDNMRKCIGTRTKTT